MGGERIAVLSHPAGCFFSFIIAIVPLIGQVVNGNGGKVFARQGEIHLCFRLQLKITDLMFNLNINKKAALCRHFCLRRAVFFCYGLAGVQLKYKDRSCCAKKYKDYISKFLVMAYALSLQL